MDGTKESRMLKDFHIFLNRLYDGLANRFFDLRYGVQTYRKRDLSRLDIRSYNILHARRYEPSSERHFRYAFSDLHRNWGEYTFYDIGCGKGKALLMASLLGVKRAIGIEFARDLCAVAADNAKQMERTVPTSSPIDIVCADASEYQFTHDGPAIFYLYNPFDSHVLKQLLNNMAHRKHKDKKDIFVYVNPLRSYLLDMKGYDLIAKVDHHNQNNRVQVYSLALDVKVKASKERRAEIKDYRPSL